MTIHISAVALLRGDAVLLVRKRGTRRFMLPGGKFDGDETPAACTVREVREELGLDLDIAVLDALGHFTAAAANEPGELVEADIFVSPLASEPHALAEIDELRWFPLGGDDQADDLAPLFVERVLPLLRARIRAAT